MKREILATLLVLVFVINGFLNSMVRDNNLNNEKANSLYEQITGEQLIFNDEFKGRIDSSWEIQDNQEKLGRISTNEKENVKVINGKLKLTTRQLKNKKITTPYMTVDKDQNGNKFNYGYYEARIKFTNNNEYPKDTSVIPGTNYFKSA